jgi:hypothetical protein
MRGRSVHGSDHGLVASLRTAEALLLWTNLLERQSIAAHEIFNDPFGKRCTSQFSPASATLRGLSQRAPYPDTLPR